MTRKVHVDLGDRSYDVSVGSGLLAELRKTVEALGGARRAVVISDSNVAGLYGAKALDALGKTGTEETGTEETGTVPPRRLRGDCTRFSGIAGDLLTFPAGEEHKTLATCSGLYDALFALDPPIDRKTVIVALGGGVSGDMAGFIAATALRGLRFVQCPTTLLAAVDASVGGKTGVDHPAGKNLIGAFHQPSAVLIDVDLLKTLRDAELANGLAECVKHGVIRDAGLLDFIEGATSAILAREPEALTELIARNVAIKAAVVSADEREAGERMHLNFGHTVGHAIENQVGYGRISHGQAVALGMVAACRIAVARGLIDAGVADRVEDVLKHLSLLTRWERLDPASLWTIMLRDKKAHEGKVRMVLPTALGAVGTFDGITEESVVQALEHLARGPA